jgi:CheY-like chemotaxis protein
LDLVTDGEAALLNLRQRAERPDLVLLDLNLPKTPGIEVLKAIKHDPLLRVVPVVILTNSAAPNDVLLCYTHHANAYIRKPVGFDDLARVMTTMSLFWFKTAVLPGQYAAMHQTSLPPPPKRKGKGPASSGRPKKK